ncbi:MAG: hypothetical protein ACRC8A_09075 [Microcoleaceae cyanobacterium]
MSNLISASILSALSASLTASPQTVETYSPTAIFTDGSSQVVQTQENLSLPQQSCVTNNASPERGTGRREW